MTTTIGERLSMTSYNCPLCSETYEERTDLRVHLEVEHRKSEVVASLVDSSAATDASTDEATLEDERPTPPV